MKLRFQAVSPQSGEMRVAMKKYVNISVLLKAVTLIGFGLFFLISIYTGSVNLYVHPRIVPFMVFAAAAMLIMALLLLPEVVMREKSKTKAWSLLFYIIPLFMAFAFPAQSLAANSSMTGEVQLSGTVYKENVKGTEKPDTMAEPTKEPDKKASLKNSSFVKDGVLMFDNSNTYYEALCEIYDNFDKYKGLPIEVIGLVFKDNQSFKEDEFVPSRLMMVCCAADMQPVGLLCQYEKASELEADTWVKVSGTLGELEFDGEMIPCIIDSSVEGVDEPDDPYIYPY